MLQDDWLLRQIEDLVRFFSGAEDEEMTAANQEETAQRSEPGNSGSRVDAELAQRTGLSLTMLSHLDPDAAVRLIGHRFGQFQPERVYTTWVLLDTAIAHDHALSARLMPIRDALHGQLVEEVGADGMTRLQDALREAIP